MTTTYAIDTHGTDGVAPTASALSPDDARGRLIKAAHAVLSQRTRRSGEFDPPRGFSDWDSWAAGMLANADDSPGARQGWNLIGPPAFGVGVTATVERERHDAASMVGQLAGLTEPGEALPPSVLIERFADRGERVDGGTVHRGFCGLRDVRDPYGFDEGYDFLGSLGEGGWAAIPEKGDWPYNVYMKRVKSGEPVYVVNYCEGDFSLWEFTDREAAQRFYEGIPDSES